MQNSIEKKLQDSIPFMMLRKNRRLFVKFSAKHLDLLNLMKYSSHLAFSSLTGYLGGGNGRCQPKSYRRSAFCRRLS